MVTKHKEAYYKKILQILGSLTNLFSESKVPFLNYRVTENLYCKAFSAVNLSRSDVSADATLNEVGVGIKTFVNGNGKSLQKVAEFNKANIEFRELKTKKLIYKVADLRNERIESTKRIYGLQNMIYHCIVRDEGKIRTFECDMNLIDKSSIKILNVTKNTISFKDSSNEYSFNITKSTLYKRFITKDILIEVDVKILADPFKILEEKFTTIKDICYSETTTANPFVILPLYSKKGDENIVYPKSGLNQWNAKGRKDKRGKIHPRDIGEVYIQIPAWIHKKFPSFFLPRDTSFNLVLPDGKVLESKVCSDASKALMSKHNADLGKWILRQVLNLDDKEVLTYNKLQEIGFDSVIIEKIDETTFSINFKKSGTYEKFMEKHK